MNPKFVLYYYKYKDGDILYQCAKYKYFVYTYSFQASVLYMTPYFSDIFLIPILTQISLLSTPYILNTDALL